MDGGTNSSSTLRLDLDTIKLGPLLVPRLWVGLWQLSSNAWGTASVSSIRRAMKHHVEEGYTAFGYDSNNVHVVHSDFTTADHYGSAENIFGSLRQTAHANIIGATKWCLFRPIKPDRSVVEDAISERLNRTKSKTIDLLQLHWQDYSDTAYVQIFGYLQEIQERGSITALGLCNFDSITTDKICEQLKPGSIISNQVQFSLIDTRPLHGMNEVCKKHDVKLLTYGSLCGGFLSDAWLGKPEPDFYADKMTPSQRKYLDMIIKAWGDWRLFQLLLTTLRQIGDRHGGASIANVSVKWVLEHDFVGAVIIGSRLGISEHTADNRCVFTFSLTAEDKRSIECVLERSNGKKLINTIGDCGAEYR